MSLENQKKMHLDASQSVFFLRELEEIDSRLFDVKYANLEVFELVQPKQLDPGAETYTYRTFDARGVAAMTSDYATGSPRADVSGVETTAKVRSLRASFGYNVQEIRAASMANRPLDAMRATAARRMINEKINAVGLLGDTDHSMQGLFSVTSAQTYTVPADGTGASALWSAKSAALIEGWNTQLHLCRTASSVASTTVTMPWINNVREVRGIFLLRSALGSETVRRPRASPAPIALITKPESLPTWRPS